MMKKINNFEKFLEKLLNEIGDSSAQSYEVRRTDDKMGYLFKTDSGVNYIISFQFIDENVIDNIKLKNVGIFDYEEFYKSNILVGFAVLKQDIEKIRNLSDIVNFDQDVVTNKFEMFRIMSTVTKVIDDVLSKNSRLKYIVFGGYGSNNDNGRKRSLFYLQYIKKRNYNSSLSDIIHTQYGDCYILKIK